MVVYDVVECIDCNVVSRFNLPKMTTTARDNLTGVVAGLIIYNTTTNKINVYNGTSWKVLSEDA